MTRRKTATARASLSTGYGREAFRGRGRRLKDIAPSHALRKRFHGKPDDWDEFRAAYFAELESEAGRAAAEELLGHLRKGPVTLLYAARDEQHNNAVALKELLERHQGKGRSQ